MKHILIAVAMFGCGTTDIDRNVCGNGLVEDGEDCDSDDAQCEACGIICNITSDFDQVEAQAMADQQCRDYDPAGGTAGFVCGADSFCHAPSGAFDVANQTTFTLPTESYRVTDVDNDHFNEILVQSATSVTAVFDAATFAATQTSIQTPIARGHAAFAFVDDNDPSNFGKTRSLDTLLPTADGIVAYTSQFGAPSPYPFPSPVPPQLGVPLFTHPVSPRHIGIVGTSELLTPGTPTLVYLIADVQTSPPMIIGGAPLCGGVEDEVDASEIQTFQTQPQHHIIAMTLRGAAARTCIVTTKFNDPDYTVQEVTLPSSPTTPTSRPVLANLRANPCPSLVVAESDGKLHEYRPTGVPTACAFMSPIDLAQAPPGELPIGSFPLTPAAPNRSATGLALTNGLYEVELVATPKLHQVYVTDRPLHNVQSIDLDNDGDVDVVASAKNSEDLDILDRRTLQPGDVTAFVRFRFDTIGPVTHFMLGDFDGNEIADVAFAETTDDGVVANSTLKIAYGTQDQLLAGATVGVFQRIQSLMAVSIPDSGDPNSVIDDVAVLFDDPATGLPAIALLHGSPQRTMLAFFDPRQQPVTGPSQFRGVAVGFFIPGSQGNDILAFEQTNVATQVYLSSGATSGMIEPANANPAGNLVDCTNAGDISSSLFCIDDVQFITWPRSFSSPMPIGNDVVIAIDNRRLEVAMIDPSDLATIPKMRWGNALKAPEGSRVRKVQRVELAGTPALLISLGPEPGANPLVSAAVNLCTFDENAGPTCIDMNAAVSNAFADTLGVPQVCVDAGTAHVAPTRRFFPPDSDQADLVILCRLSFDVGDQEMIIDRTSEALYRVSFGPDLAVHSITTLVDFVRADELQIGDVSGDGIDDIILLDRQAAVPRMTVLRQCTSRDTACTELSVPPEMPKVPESMP